MKVLIINAYDRSSKGDAVLLSQSIKIVRLTFPDAKISISSMEDPAKFPHFENCRNFGSFRLVGDAPHLYKPLRMLYKLLIIVTTLSWAHLNGAGKSRAEWLLPRRVRVLCRQHYESDLVVSVAGGYLNAKPGLYGNFNVFFLAHALRFATNLKKPVILLNQTIGPFGNKLQLRLARWGLQDVRLIITREKISYQLVKKLDMPRPKIHASIDLGFLAKTQARVIDHAVHIKKICITASVRLQPSAQVQYEQAFSQFMNREAAKNTISFVGMPQSTSTYQNDGDQAIYERMLALSDKGVFTIEKRPLDYFQIVKEYARYDMIVGTRFHSVIFSLINFKPSIAVEYDYKTTGVMKDLGLEKWVIAVEDVTAERLSRLFKDLSQNYDTYVRLLAKRLPAYRQRAKLLPALMRQAYGSSTKP